MMEAASTSEMSANFYQITRRNNPEYSHFRTRRRENLKSHIVTSAQQSSCQSYVVRTSVFVQYISMIVTLTN
jgi:hypothetical protein